MALNAINFANQNSEALSSDKASPGLVLKSKDNGNLSITKTCNRVLKGDKSLASTIQSQVDTVKIEQLQRNLPGSFHRNPNFYLGAIENSLVNTFSSYSYSTPTSCYNSKVGVDCFFVDEIKKNVAIFYLFSGVSDFSKLEELNSFVSSKPSNTYLPGRKKNITIDKDIRSDNSSSKGSSMDDNTENAVDDPTKNVIQTCRIISQSKVALNVDHLKFPENPLTTRKKNQSYTTPEIISVAIKKDAVIIKNEVNDDSIISHIGSNNILSKLKQKRAKSNKHVTLLIPEGTKDEAVSDQQIPEKIIKSQSLKNVIANSRTPRADISKSSFIQFKDQANETFAEYADAFYLKILKKSFKSSMSPNIAIIESVTSTINSYLGSLASKKLSNSQREKLHQECEVSIVMIIDEYAWVATKGNCRVVASFKDGEEISRLSSILDKRKTKQSYVMNNYVQESNASTVEINLFRLPPDIDFICFLGSDILNTIMNREMVSNVFQALLKELEFSTINSGCEINNSSVLYKAMRLIFNQHLKEYSIDNISYAIMLFKNFTVNISKEKIWNIKSIMNRINLSTPFYDNNDIYPLVLNNNNIQFEFSDQKRIKKVELNSSDYSNSLISKNHFKVIYKTICLCFKRKERQVTNESNLNSSSFVKVSNQKIEY